jgi:hypothetical protein
MALPVEAFDDPELWYVGVQDADNVEIYRRDIPSSQLASLQTSDPKIVLLCEFESGAVPASWTVWPVSRSLGWLSRIEGTLGDEDYTIVLDDDTE